MAFWLARERYGQDSDYIQRFDPRFWTIDFPRPMMGSVVSTGPDALRVEVEYHHKDALAGLIWDSEDRLDHPLLAYDTVRDYSHSILRFRWRSGGVMPLDAVHGPTLTIEGADEAGNPRTWFVRLWNYAEGSPTDAEIVLPFSDLAGGWDIDVSPDPVDARRVDRMFISLVPPGYDPADEGLLPARTDGWVEMTGISCEGERAMLGIGDVMVPEHGVGMATAYDDSYNQTPARLLRNIRGLGYRDEVIHYLGMSHYFRLMRQADNSLLATDLAVWATPARAWHAAYLALCKEQGYTVIFSFSFELFAAHCPADWMQRAHDGTPGLTGWDPPSALLSASNTAAVAQLRALALQLGQLLQTAGLPVKVQIGEPWWWVNSDHAPCIYDDASRSLIASGTPDITDMREAPTSAQKTVMDTMAGKLGEATGSISQAIQASFPGAEVLLLAFTPTIYNPALPEMARLNLPGQWANPAFDRLQVEDYDWLTAGAEALRRKAYTELDLALGYPLAKQDYMAGFVLDSADAEIMWPLIDAGLDEAARRGVPRLFVWALPQVCRDGYTRLPSDRSGQGEHDEGIEMQAFDNVLYPLALGRDASVSPEFSTAVTLMASGHERRTSHWTDARLRYDVGPGIRSEEELGVLLQFFRARRGAARGFRLSDPFDFSSNGMTGNPTMLDQLIGIGDGVTATFQLIKSYGTGSEPQRRPITRPRGETIVVSVDGTQTSQWMLDDGGSIVLEDAPAQGAQIRAGFLFDVPVRFAEDRIEISGASFAAGEAPSVPLVEIREAT